MSDHVSWGVLVTSIFSAAIRSGTPMAFAAIGETLAERSGVINLGLEGLMLVGAMVGVAVEVGTRSTVLALFSAGTAAAALAAIHGFVVIRLGRSQIVSGLAISILGTGISGFLGRSYVGVKFNGIPVWRVPYLDDLPFVGPVFFQHDPLVYLAALVAVGSWFLIYRTRFGLQLRAVGEDPDAAFAQGVPVRQTRMIAVLLGGFLAGIGGAHLSLAYTHLWAERMTAGQGWIAIGLVIVAGWRPGGALIAAYCFGALTALHPNLQAAGFAVSPYLLATLPYLAAVLALVLATSSYLRTGRGLPGALMKQFLAGGA